MEDNEWQKFFEELGTLLNKYHFGISDFTLGAIPKRIKLYSFKNNLPPIHTQPVQIILSRFFTFPRIYNSVLVHFILL